jgi:meso-butanediol dehydrogenase/(S,S)-butanediol dehydrogenase/diacetyl reductase
MDPSTQEAVSGTSRREGRFDGRVALVTGAGSGIGQAVARALSAEGASVALAGRTHSRLESTAASLPAGRTLVVPFRHEDPELAQAAVERVIEVFGRLDILVNNAGEYSAGTAADTPPESWRSAIAVNLDGPFLVTRAALPHLRRRRGSIVNVASTLAFRPLAGAAPYCAAKAGLLMLTRVTALEESATGVRVNAVCPGVVDTPIHRRRAGDGPEGLEEFLRRMGKAHPLGRVGRPEEVASLILFLASDESAWTTGAAVSIDGGISLL